jgi:hypothetical protein
MNCCQCICPQNDPCRGATGATGPTGPSGASRIANFYNSSTGVIGNNIALNLFENVNLATTDISHSFGSSDVILVTTGYYLITFYADVTRTTDGTVSLKMTANGSDIPLSPTTAYATANNATSLSNSFIFNNTNQNTTLNLVNSSGVSASFTNVSVVIQKVYS